MNIYNNELFIHINDLNLKALQNKKISNNSQRENVLNVNSKIENISVDWNNKIDIRNIEYIEKKNGIRVRRSIIK